MCGNEVTLPVPGLYRLRVMPLLRQRASSPGEIEVKSLKLAMALAQPGSAIGNVAPILFGWEVTDATIGAACRRAKLPQPNRDKMTPIDYIIAATNPELDIRVRAAPFSRELLSARAQVLYGHFFPCEFYEQKGVVGSTFVPQLPPLSYVKDGGVQKGYEPYSSWEAGVYIDFTYPAGVVGRSLVTLKPQPLCGLGPVRAGLAEADRAPLSVPQHQEREQELLTSGAPEASAAELLAVVRGEAEFDQTMLKAFPKVEDVVRTWAG